MQEQPSKKLLAMNREIKFRGLNLHGNWRYGNLAVVDYSSIGGISATNIPAGTYISNTCGMAYAYEVRPETVGQSTGMKDASGREIWEGDIVRYVVPALEDSFNEPNIPDEDELFSESVDFKDGCFVTDNYAPLGVAMNFDCVVVGNVFQNPELLNNAQN